jgi:CBS domain-containing protein
VTAVPSSTTIRNAVSLMLENDTDELLVADDGTVRGVFHLRDAGALL